MPYALRAFGSTVWYHDENDSPASAPVGVLSTSIYLGSGNVVPVALPAALSSSQWYAVGNMALDAQPVVCTAPLPQGNRIAAGSLFVLLFALPSAYTRNVLANGATVSMTFLLYGGVPVTGQVTMTSTFTDPPGLLEVVCSVVTDIFL